MQEFEGKTEKNLAGNAKMLQCWNASMLQCWNASMHFTNGS